MNFISNIPINLLHLLHYSSPLRNVDRNLMDIRYDNIQFDEYLLDEDPQSFMMTRYPMLRHMKRSGPGYNARLMKRPEQGYNARLMKKSDGSGNYKARLMKKSFTDYNKRLMKRSQSPFQNI